MDGELLAIRRVIKRTIPQVHACFEHGRTYPRIDWSFVIDRRGRVTSSRVEGAPPALKRCLQGVFTKLRFPPPKHAPLTVSYPLLICVAGQ